MVLAQKDRIDEAILARNLANINLNQALNAARRRLKDANESNHFESPAPPRLGEWRCSNCPGCRGLRRLTCRSSDPPIKLCPGCQGGEECLRREELSPCVGSPLRTGQEASLWPPGSLHFVPPPSSSGASITNQAHLLSCKSRIEERSLELKEATVRLEHWVAEASQASLASVDRPFTSEGITTWVEERMEVCEVTLDALNVKIEEMARLGDFAGSEVSAHSARRHTSSFRDTEQDPLGAVPVLSAEDILSARPREVAAISHGGVLQAALQAPMIPHNRETSLQEWTEDRVSVENGLRVRGITPSQDRQVEEQVSQGVDQRSLGQPSNILRFEEREVIQEQAQLREHPWSTARQDSGTAGGYVGGGASASRDSRATSRSLEAELHGSNSALLRRARTRALSEKKDIEEKVNRAEVKEEQLSRNEVQVLQEQVKRVESLVDRMEELNTQGTEEVVFQVDSEVNKIRRWTRQVRTRITCLQVGQRASTPGVRPELSLPNAEGRTGQGMLRKIAAPKFSGLVLQWGKFKRQFCNLTDPEGLSDPVLLAHLEEALPKEALVEIEGMENLSEVWETLDRVYGDPQLNALTVKTQLLNFRFSKTEQWEKVEELAKAIKRAQSALGQNWEDRMLAADESVVSSLVNRLPVELVSGWDRFIRKRRAPASIGECDSQDRWRKFLDWIQEEKEVAWEARRRVMTEHLGRSIEPARAPGRIEVLPLLCAKCTGAHKTSNCKVASSLLTPQLGAFAISGASAGQGGQQPLKTKGEMEQQFLNMKVKWGVCPVCSLNHSRTRIFDFDTGEEGLEPASGPCEWLLLGFKDCPKFIAAEMSPEARAHIIEGENACPLCTDRQHNFRRCRRRLRTDVGCKVVANGSVCGLLHHPLLHGSKSAYCFSAAFSGSPATASSTGEREEDVPEMFSNPCLLEIMRSEVFSTRERVAGREAIIFTDVGSNCNLVTHRFARMLGLKPMPYSYWLTVVGAESALRRTSIYKLWFGLGDGSMYALWAVGIEEITDTGAAPCLEGIRHFFPDAPDQVFRRPQGAVDILIGAEELPLHPFCYPKGEVGKLRLSSSRLGCGWVLSGSSDLVVHRPPGLPAKTKVVCLHIKASQGYVLEEPQVVTLPTFFEAEEMGVATPRTCVACRGCEECTFRTESMTRAEQEVVARLQESMSFDERGRISFSYPFKPCVVRMESNREQALQRQRRTEVKLVRRGLLGEYTKEMQKAFDAGACRILPEEEMREWTGPVNYIPLFEVIKESSVSTRLRVVTNCAMINNKAQLSINECQWPGPGALASLFGCLIHFRSVQVALVVDLRKAYWSIGVGKLEAMVRRFLWREQPELPWLDCCWAQATFGDINAGLCLALAIKKAAFLGVSLDKLAAKQLTRFSYVDDACMGGSAEEVARMKGVKAPDGSYSGTVPAILAMVGLEVKFMCATNGCSEEEAEQVGGAVLGQGFDPRTDLLEFKLAPRFNSKLIGQQGGVETILSTSDVQRIREGQKVLSRRQCLSIMMGFFDPLGLMCPILIRGKILLRLLYGRDYGAGWDGDMPQVQKEQWCCYLEDLLGMPTFKFPRSIHPMRAEGEPWLVGLSDGSLSAAAAVIWARWTVGGQVVTALVAAKSRVSPTKGMTVPRAELNGFVLLLRLMSTITSSASFFPDRMILLTDSECTIAALLKSGSGLNPYFANRVAEATTILQTLGSRCRLLEPPAAIPGVVNTADLATRGRAQACDLDSGAEWQIGPAFLKWPREEWPTSQPPASRVPVQELRTRHEIKIFLTRSSIALPRRLQELVARASLYTNSWQRSQGVIARGLRLMRSPGVGVDVVGFRSPVSAEERRLARELQFIGAAPGARLAFGTGAFRNLGAYEARDQVWVSTRVRSEFLSEELGVPNLRLITADSRLATLIMIHAHSVDHRRDPKAILAASRSYAWIVSGNKLAKKIAALCPACRASAARPQQQVMGELPEETYRPAPCFLHTAMDLMGPYKIRPLGRRNGRETFLSWVCVFVCLTTRAISLVPCPGYGASELLDTLSIFTATYGVPTSMRADHGTNIQAIAGNVNWRKIATELGLQGIRWDLTPKACSWRNGLAEAIIKLAKRQLHKSLSSGLSLNLHQFSGALARIANLLNNRPLAVRDSTEQQFHTITANDLLHGRGAHARPEESEGLLEQEDKMAGAKLQAQERLVRQYWFSFQRQVIPELAVRKTWDKKFRNVKEGDICNVTYKGKFNAPGFRICIIRRLYPDAHGVVRTVEVELRPRRAKEAALPYVYKSSLMTVAVQRLTVLWPHDEVDLEMTGKDSVDIPKLTGGEVIRNLPAHQPIEVSKQLIAFASAHSVLPHYSGAGEITEPADEEVEKLRVLVGESDDIGGSKGIEVDSRHAYGVGNLRIPRSKVNLRQEELSQ